MKLSKKDKKKIRKHLEKLMRVSVYSKALENVDKVINEIEHHDFYCDTEITLNIPIKIEGCLIQAILKGE